MILIGQFMRILLGSLEFGKMTRHLSRQLVLQNRYCRTSFEICSLEVVHLFTVVDRNGLQKNHTNELPQVLKENGAELCTFVSLS